MDTEARDKALLNLLASLADNKYYLGRRYAEWCNGAPTLEAAVAAAAMAQDELGHARAIYPLLRSFPGVDPTEVEPETRQHFWNVSFLDTAFTGWPDFVAANFLLDTALTVLFEAARDSSFEPLRGRARKVLQEEHVHELHSEGWIRRLAKAGGTVPTTLGESLKRMWAETLCWFGPPEDAGMKTLRDDDVLDALPEELRARFLARIGPTLVQTGLHDALGLTRDGKHWVLMTPLPWSEWHATTRRLAAERAGVWL
jgi:phenylacetate-CoA oxygenase PaaI subunit